MGNIQTRQLVAHFCWLHIFRLFVCCAEVPETKWFYVKAASADVDAEHGFVMGNNLWSCFKITKHNNLIWYGYYFNAYRCFLSRPLSYCAPINPFYFAFSGCCHRKPLLVPGGRAFVWPGIQYVQRYPEPPCCHFKSWDVMIEWDDSGAKE